MRRGLAAALLVLAAGCELGTDPDGGATVTISPEGGTLTAIQDTLRLAAEVRSAGGGLLPGAPVTWVSLDAEIASVDAQGRVVSRASGEARIVASAEGASDTVTVAVEAEASDALLRFIELAATAPPLETYDTSFWAVRGEERELRIRTLGTAGEQGEHFLDFEVGDESLLRRPDGTAFAVGDSVEIHVTVDPERFRFTFEPSGLVFDPEEPASLELRYRHADEDDLEREEEFSMWKQESPGSPWLRIATLRLEDADELEAEITSFTAFALATR